jgi:hypothetical protein
MLDLKTATIEQVTITCHEDDIQHVMRWLREGDFHVGDVSAKALIKSEAHAYVVIAQRPFDARVALSNPLDVRTRDLFSGLSVASGGMDALPASVNPRMFERSATIIEAGARRIKLTRDDRKALLSAVEFYDSELSKGPSILSKSAREQLEDRPSEKTEKRIGGNKTRVELDIPKHRAEAIKALMEKTNLPTEVEFYNAAFSLFAWAIGEKRAGRTIGSLEDKMGGLEFHPLVFFPLDRVRRQL